MRLYIVRHGRKASASPDYDGGWNAPLTETGTEQAEHLGEFLADEGVDSVYSSCLLRSLQTAAPVHDHVGGEWHVWPVFCETDPATLPERHAEKPDVAVELAAWPTGDPVDPPTDEELSERDGNYYLLSSLPERFPDARLSQPFPWPEAWWVPQTEQTRSMGYARAQLGLHALVERHRDGGSVAVVCHGNIADKMITALMDFPRRQPGRFDFDYTGVACLQRREPDRWAIEYANRTAHLPPDLQR